MTDRTTEADESPEKDDADFALLRESVSRFANLPDAAFEDARSCFKRRSFAKNEILARPGEPARFVFFIVRGLARLYYEVPGGKQTNKSFAREGMFVAGNLRGPGENDFGTEALEPMETLAIQIQDLGGLAAREPAWKELQTGYVAWLGERKVRREKQLLLESAEERYIGFQHDFPDIAERIPQYHVALYLGITDVALSRIKKRIRDGAGSS